LICFEYSALVAPSHSVFSKQFNILNEPARTTSIQHSQIPQRLGNAKGGNGLWLVSFGYVFVVDLAYIQ
jgi:hypothetical protein